MARKSSRGGSEPRTQVRGTTVAVAAPTTVVPLTCVRGSLLALALAACAPEPPALPSLDTSNFLPQVRQPIDEAHAQAQANPNDAEASGRLGMILQAQEEWAPARDWLLRAQALDPKSFAWPYYLSFVFIQLAGYDDALAHVDQALALDAGYLPAQLSRARLIFDAGRLDDAEALYAKLSETNPNPEAFYGLGRCLAARDDARGATQAFDKALERFPSYGAALFAMSEQLRRQGWAEEAEQKRDLARQYQELGPPLDDPYLDRVNALAMSAVAFIERGRRQVSSGEHQQAVETFEKAAELDPSSAQALINLIALHGERGQPAEAERAYERAIAINPNEAEAHFNFGVLRLIQQRYDEARAALERATEINPRDPDALYNLGFALENVNESKAALASYLRAVQERPSFTDAHFRAGLILFNQGRYREAVTSLKQTLDEVSESTPQHLYALAMALGAEGQTSPAIETLQRAHRLAQQFEQTELAAQIADDLHRLQ